MMPIHVEQNLQESELTYAAILAGVADGIIAVDTAGCVRYMNPVAESLTGWGLEAARGLPVEEVFMLVDETTHERVENRVCRALSERTEPTFAPPVLLQNRQGGSIPIDHSVAPIIAPGGKITGAVAAFRDVTERYESRKRLQHHLERLAALRAIDVCIVHNRDLLLTLGLILDQARQILRIDAAAVLLLNRETHLFEYAVRRGFRDSSRLPLFASTPDDPVEMAAREGRTITLADLPDAGAAFQQARSGFQTSFTDYYAIPLVAAGSVRGVLEIYQRSELHPDRAWLECLESLAGQAAIATDNAWLFDDLERANEGLVTSHDATIEGWSRALDLRDKETEGHSERVTEMTVQLARAMGIEGETLLQMKRGALLHDVGKLGIPDKILLKPGPLTDEEWVIMRKHPTYAYEMLYPITFLRPALEIPYCHHEKWDGTGYPNELKGEDIPLAARIFAIADVYDALRSDRPYRAGWPVERVREHISSLAGTHFDPAVVDAFLKLDQPELVMPLAA